MEQHNVFVAAFKAKGHVLSKYGTPLCFSLEEQIRRVVKGLRSDLQIQVITDNI